MTCNVVADWRGCGDRVLFIACMFPPGEKCGVLMSASLNTLHAPFSRRLTASVLSRSYYLNPCAMLCSVSSQLSFAEIRCSK